MGRLCLRGWALRRLILCARHRTGGKQRDQRRTAKKTHATDAISMNRHDTPPSNGVGYAPAYLRSYSCTADRVVSKASEVPRSLAVIAAQNRTQQCRRKSTDRLACSRRSARAESDAQQRSNSARDADRMPDPFEPIRHRQLRRLGHERGRDQKDRGADRAITVIAVILRRTGLRSASDRSVGDNRFMRSG